MFSSETYSRHDYAREVLDALNDVSTLAMIIAEAPAAVPLGEKDSEGVVTG
jgi:hypothetical protein